MVMVGSWVRLARGDIYESEPKSVENKKKKIEKTKSRWQIQRAEQGQKQEMIQTSGIGQNWNGWQVRGGQLRGSPRVCTCFYGLTRWHVLGSVGLKAPD